MAGVQVIKFSDSDNPKSKSIQGKPVSSATVLLQLCYIEGQVENHESEKKEFEEKNFILDFCSTYTASAALSLFFVSFSKWTIHS